MGGWFQDAEAESKEGFLRMPAIGRSFDPDQEEPIEIANRSCCPECKPGMCRLMILPPPVGNRNSACTLEHLCSVSQPTKDGR